MTDRTRRSAHGHPLAQPARGIGVAIECATQKGSRTESGRRFGRALQHQLANGAEDATTVPVLFCPGQQRSGRSKPLVSTHRALKINARSDLISRSGQSSPHGLGRFDHGLDRRSSGETGRPPSGSGMRTSGATRDRRESRLRPLHRRPQAEGDPGDQGEGAGPISEATGSGDSGLPATVLERIEQVCDRFKRLAGWPAAPHRGRAGHLRRRREECTT